MNQFRKNKIKVDSLKEFLKSNNIDIKNTRKL